MMTAQAVHVPPDLARIIPSTSPGWSFTVDSDYVCDELMVKMISMQVNRYADQYCSRNVTRAFESQLESLSSERFHHPNSDSTTGSGSE